MKVFVSSTYVDLKEHRKAVDEILNRLSLQYRGMEYFGSRPLESKKACFEEIAQCDIFIGIYAHRYGYISPGDSTSITEQEFDYAKKNGLKTYCYLVDPKHPWPPIFIESTKAAKLQKFVSKIRALVISHFTTPDNLAKQIAADIKASFETSTSVVEDTELVDLIHKCCINEISTTIGPKYIRELYVNRSLDENLRQSLNNAIFVTKDIGSIRKSCHALMNVIEDELKNNNDSKIPKKAHRSVRSLRETLDQLSGELKAFEDTSFAKAALCFPATELTDILEAIRKSITNTKETILGDSLSGRAIKRIELEKRWKGLGNKIFSGIDLLRTKLKPINLIVDRAGGGKTNLLCKLAEVLGETKPCFFVAAKSIPLPSEEAIVKYLSSAYQIKEDPIQVLRQVAINPNNHVVLIIDGINESLDPIQFNSAFKSLVKRYQGFPVRFIVSCRDIYWNYFEDDWWDAHCEKIYRDILYEYTENEFDKALPLYLNSYNIQAHIIDKARSQLHHPLLLRFFCEAFSGTEDNPSDMGVVEDIRLLELFDAYCSRKFRQIQERLGLVSSEEIFEYLEMVALMMLENKKRILPVKALLHKARKEFGESESRTVNSRYVQILDEDILLEEKPSGVEMRLKVGFVYDEFMEYVIAKALWSDLISKYRQITATEIKKLAEDLLLKKKEFVSVLGVITYLAELLLRQTHHQGVQFIDWLTRNKMESLSFRITRVPKDAIGEDLFDALTFIHKSASDRHLQKNVWDHIKGLHQQHWTFFYSYLQEMPLKGDLRPNRVFVFFRKVGCELTSEQVIETIKWIVSVFREQNYMTTHSETTDYKSGIKTMKCLIETFSPMWSSAQVEEAKDLLKEAQKIKPITDRLFSNK